MSEATDTNNELDQYGVWVKTPPHNALEDDTAEASANTEITEEIALDDFITDGFTDPNPGEAGSELHTSPIPESAADEYQAVVPEATIQDESEEDLASQSVDDDFASFDSAAKFEIPALPDFEAAEAEQFALEGLQNQEFAGSSDFTEETSSENESSLDESDSMDNLSEEDVSKFISAIQGTDLGIAEESVVEEPAVAEDSVVEEPVVEEQTAGVADEAIIEEEPVVEETAGVADEIIIEESVPEETAAEIDLPDFDDSILNSVNADTSSFEISDSAEQEESIPETSTEEFFAEEPASEEITMEEASSVSTGLPEIDGEVDLSAFDFDIEGSTENVPDEDSFEPTVNEQPAPIPEPQVTQSETQNVIEEISTDSFLDSMEDGEISLDEFISEAELNSKDPAGPSPIPSASVENFTPDGEIPLDAFLDMDELIQEKAPEQAATSEVDEKPLDIDLSFDDSVEVQEEEESDFDLSDLDSIISGADSTDDGSEAIDFDEFMSDSVIQDETPATDSAEPVVSNVEDEFSDMFEVMKDETGGIITPGNKSQSSGTSDTATTINQDSFTMEESIDLSEFGLDDSSDNTEVDSKTSSTVKEDVDFEMTVGDDEVDEDETSEEMQDDISSNVSDENISLEMEDGTSDEISSDPTFESTGDDFDLDSILSNITDEDGNTVDFKAQENTVTIQEENKPEVSNTISSGDFSKDELKIDEETYESILGEELQQEKTEVDTEIEETVENAISGIESVSEESMEETIDIPVDQDIVSEEASSSQNSEEISLDSFGFSIDETPEDTEAVEEEVEISEEVETSEEPVPTPADENPLSLAVEEESTKPEIDYTVEEPSDIPTMEEIAANNEGTVFEDPMTDAPEVEEKQEDSIEMDSFIVGPATEESGFTVEPTVSTEDTVVEEAVDFAETPVVEETVDFGENQPAEEIVSFDSIPDAGDTVVEEAAGFTETPAAEETVSFDSIPDAGEPVVEETVDFTETPDVEETVSFDSIPDAGDTAVEEAVNFAETPAVEETVDFAETPVVEEAAGFAETPVVEEAAGFDETPAAEETVSFDSIPDAEEPVVEEAVDFTETPVVEEAAGFAETPAAEETVSFDSIPDAGDTAVEEAVNFTETPAAEEAAGFDEQSFNDEAPITFQEDTTQETEAETPAETESEEIQDIDGFEASINSSDDEFTAMLEKEKAELISEPVFTQESVTINTSIIPDTFDEEAASLTENQDETQEDNSMEAENNEILRQIAGELSSLKSEIDSLKTEFADLKKNGVSAKTEGPVQESNSAGFFGDEDDDDTVALSGEELNNILTTANFTEEDAQIEVQEPIEEEEPEFTSESEEKPEGYMSEDDLEIVQPSTLESLSQPIDLFADDTPSPLTERSFEYLSEEVNESDYSDMVMPEGPFDESEDESEEDEVLEKGISDEPTEAVFAGWTEAPAEEVIQAEPEFTESESTHETSSEETEQVNEFADEATTEIELDAEPEVAFEEVSETEDEVVPEVSFEEAPEDEEESITPSLADIMADIGGSGDSEESDEDSISGISLTSDELLNVQSEPVQEEEGIPQEIEGVDSLVTKPQCARPSDSSSIPADMKEEIKSVLSYMDQLLENLPEDKIAEFAQSEQFETYKKLFAELGLS